jgi:protein ImuB
MYACLLMNGWAADIESPDLVLLDVAQQYSPRAAWVAPHTIVLDLSGLERLFGEARTIGNALRGQLADRGLQAHIAIAGTRTAAHLLAVARAGLTVVDPGGDAAALAPLSIDVLTEIRAVPPESRVSIHGPTRFYRSSPVQELVRPRRRVLKGDDTPAAAGAGTGSALGADLLATLRRWGIRTLGQVAALPGPELAARLGTDGPRVQALARGEDAGPLVPVVADETFEAALALDWPVEGLEPLSFVLSRLMDPICAHLDRRGRAAAILHVALRLVTRVTWARRLELPSPVKDPRVLRTLALLDLESHPPPAGIDAVTVRVEPTAARTLQHSLLERARPRPDQVSTLMARLMALMGERRVGRPMLVDSHRPGAFEMAPFTGEDAPPSYVGPSFRPRRSSKSVVGAEAVSSAEHDSTYGPPLCVPALRRFRQPLLATVVIEEGRPVRMRVSARADAISGGHVVTCAGPWRPSGDWWADTVWDHDEWDVGLDTGVVCRLFRDRRKDRWYVAGAYD